MTLPFLLVVVLVVVVVVVVVASAAASSSSCTDGSDSLSEYTNIHRCTLFNNTRQPVLIFATS